MDRVLEELRRARDRLLDLSARNRLLNFRPSKRSSIRIVDEMPEELWRLLVVESRQLSFLAREEHEFFEHGPGRLPPAAHPNDEGDEGQEEQDLPELFDLPDMKTALADGQMPSRYKDLFLQTPLDGENLQTNLLRIDQAARSALEERGVNFLFLAMGFVVWQPADGSDQQFRAPIVLVPVGLERAGVRKRFKLTALDEEPIVNPCLIAKLEREFRVSLPAGPEDPDAFDIDAYLKSVEAELAGLAGWRVTHDIHLSLFSFTKYLMYLDLDPDRWPKDKGLVGNGLVRAMCGDEQAAVPDLGDLPEVRDVIDALDPEEVYQVQDADSSQIKAILAAKAGKSLVIEGPPGTGKSQTITNVIAECLAAGRTVLFVSEKMAALEVVRARLEGSGLGDFCLQLHSTKSNRRSVLEELNRAWTRTKAAPRTDGAARLVKLRDRLNQYVKALHEPFDGSGLTPFAAMGRVGLLKDVPDVICEMPGHESWDPKQFEAQKELIEQLARQLAVVHPAAEHPWRAAGTRLVTSQFQQTVTEILGRLREAIEATMTACRQVAGTLGVSEPGTQQGIKALTAAAKLVCDSPEPEARLVQGGSWDEQTAELEELLAGVKAHVEGRQWMKDRYRPDAAGEVDWQEMLGRCMKYWASFARWFRGQYWRDRRAFKDARVPAHRPRFAEQVADLKQLARLQALRLSLDSSSDVGMKYFGDAWHGASSDWARIVRLNDWLRQFRPAVRKGLIGQAGEALAVAGQDRSALAKSSAELEQRLNAWDQQWTCLSQAVQMREQILLPTGMPSAPIGELRRAVAAMARRVDLLFDWAQYQDALQACEGGPLAGFVSRAAERVEPELLPLALEKQYMRLMVEEMLARREELRRFNGPNHEADRKAYAQIDRAWVCQTGNRLQAKLAAEQPALNLQAARSSQVGILLGEINRKRGGRPIRKLLRDAGEAIQRLTPCFMMSPLSVAQFIDPAGIRFDVVVFDEASQVEPADAIGAIARGKQLLLVGDPKQLPPTNFFNVMAGEDSGLAGDGTAGITDMESILHRGLAVLPKLRLRWHYRSRHESLIAFSNREFYDNELVVFPSCQANTDDLGLHMQYEPSDAYDRGRSQKNPAQAKRVAQWVCDFARQHPEGSLGVGAFSVAQQQAILDEIEKTRLHDESLEGFFARDKLEPFFVKNLETIQGDERDVIVLSVGYGKSLDQERLSMNFGPLNQEGGWRRLNVLVTRARRRCVVFSSVRAEDFDLQAAQARGVQALRDYLDYALSGRLSAIETGDGQFGSDFERAVYNALAEQGLTLQCQVGCAGYAIDLGVIDPNAPGKYVLGIECDGAMYHSSACARDRDRLRQQVLEGLGWKIHRIWSTDWFRKPQAELERALDAVRRASSGRWKPMLSESSRQPRLLDHGRDGDGEGSPAENMSLAQPYERYERRVSGSAEEFYVGPIDDIADVLAEVVRCEGPVHQDVALRRAAGAWGLSRVGSKIVERATRAMALCRKRGQVELRDGFLWPKGMDRPPVRRRDEEELRDVDMISLEEIGHGACLLLKSQLGMSRQDLVTQTAHLLGFANTGARIGERVDQAIGRQIDGGAIRADSSGMLRAT